MTDFMEDKARCIAAVSNNERRRCRVDEPALADTGFLCKGHFKKLERSLAEAPAILEWLRRNLRPPQAVNGEKVSGSREDPAPLRVEVLDKADGIAELVASWCRLMCEERQIEKVPTSIHGQAALMVTHVRWIAAQAWVDDLITEFQDASWDAHKSAPWMPGRHKLPAACPSCDAKTLIRDDGDDEVTCDRDAGGCGSSWPEESYKRLVVVLAYEIKQSRRAARKLVSTARKIAVRAHATQYDKAGELYIEHPAAVAKAVADLSAEHEAAAWLHDVLEDTAITSKHLMSKGITKPVLAAVDALTRREGEKQAEYYERLAKNPIALDVKRADIAHNSDPERLALLDEITRDRLTLKYAKATAMLDQLSMKATA